MLLAFTGIIVILTFNGFKKTGATHPRYTELPPAPEVPYSYQVSAVNMVGEGPKAGPVLATPVVSAPPSGVYGVGVSGDTRNNHPLNGKKLAYRFRATTTSTPTTIRISERGKGGANTYSNGDGSTIRATIQTDNGGYPSGTVLATAEWNPGNPSGNWEVWPPHTFTSAVSLTSGQLYHIVFENLNADPAANYISLNTLFTYKTIPDKPLFGSDYATLYPSTTESTRTLLLQMPNVL